MYLILHGWRRWNDAERAPGKGSLSYARKAYEVKTKMIRSAWESRMYNGPGAVCSASTSATRAVPSPPTSPASGFTSPRRAYQPRSDPHNPAPPHREACESRSASLCLPESPDPPAVFQKPTGKPAPQNFGFVPAGLAALTSPALVEPISCRECFLSAPVAVYGQCALDRGGTLRRQAPCPGTSRAPPGPRLGCSCVTHP